MKKSLALLYVLVCISCGYVMAQTTVDRSAAVQEMNQGDQNFMRAEYYSALKNYQTVASQMEQLGLTSDSLYYSSWNMIGRCYFRTEQYDAAIDATQRSIQLYLETRDSTSLQYAMMLDNISFYYLHARRNEEADKANTKARDIYYSKMTNDADMKATLIHGAEIKDALGLYEDAISLQKHGASLQAKLYGEHNKLYLSELDYLKRYYEHAGKSEEAEKVNEEIEKIKHEMEYGYVPVLTNFDSAEKCLEHRVDAYYCSRYLLRHYLNADRMSEAANYVVQWSFASDELLIHINNSPWLNDTTMVYMAAMIAGNVIYALETPEDDRTDFDQYKKGFISMLNCYSNNKQFTGEVPYFETYLALYAKNEKKFYSRVEKDYAEMIKSEQKNAKKK